MILAIDVGKGTTDIMLYDPRNIPENSLQLVTTSTAQILARKVRESEADILYIDGETMAGEPWHKEVYNRCAKKEGSVVMTPQAARSLRYNLEQVRGKGVTILEKEEFDCIAKDQGNLLHTVDIDWHSLEHFLQLSGISIVNIDTVLLCAQDHGEPEDPNHSTRDFRMKAVYGKLEKDGRLEDLLWPMDEIPDFLPRLQGIAQSANTYFKHLSSNNIFVMDSSPAVIIGAREDYELVSEPHHIVINVGNGHTLATLFENDEVLSVFELHTGGVKADGFTRMVLQVFSGKLDHDKILEKGGHGVFSRRVLTDDLILKAFPMTVIGPNRRKLEDLSIEFAHPWGSMMMAGPIGLVRAFEYSKKI